ncbi:MAG TPA: hypothetical protein VNX26_12110 [Candidatus Acidoferrum sp.]|jgi:hypothetical protein|nr:hypothetical protein [Candidatus Acidoferrum sp.]
MARICILLLTLAVAALGQTSTDLNAKYPNVIAYRVRPHVLMTARFGSDGQVCEMTLEKGQRTDTSILDDLVKRCLSMCTEPGNLGRGKLGKLAIK